MACAPCAAARAAAAKKAREGKLADAAKIVAAGASALIGATSKDELAAVVESIDTPQPATNVKKY